MQIEFVSDPVRLNDFAAGWDALADDLNQPRARGSIITAWARHIMDPTRSSASDWQQKAHRRSVCRRVAAESLPRERERLLPPGAGFIYGITPIARPDREREIAVALVGELATTSNRDDVVGIDAMPPHSPWAEAITHSLNGPEWVALDPVHHNLSYTDLEGGMEGWLDRRQSKFKKNLRRRARIQEAEGFGLRCTAEPEEINTRLPALQTLYTERQRLRGAHGIDSMCRLVAAIEEALDLSLPGRIRMTAIERDDTVKAIRLELRAGHRTSGWMTGFDAASGRLGPGKAALAGAIAASAESGDRIFDLGGGDELYKSDFVDGGFPPRGPDLVQPKNGPPIATSFSGEAWSFQSLVVP